MSAKQIQNVAASVRGKLLQHARDRREDYQYVLLRYALERLLYRLSRSPHADRFVLKGATLFQLWSDQPHRPTRDLDLLGNGDPSPNGFVDLFRDISSLDVEDDGLVFPPDKIRAEQIKEDDEYQGIRVRLEALIGSGRIALQIDVGFGDAITPGATSIEYPTLLGQAAPALKAYPKETVVAEKFQAMVSLGMSNSRMKDFYDLWVLATQFRFEGGTICRAIEATFRRRHTALPSSTPIALTEEFAGDAGKSRQWNAFLTKGKLVEQSLTLPEVVFTLQPFLMEPVRALTRGKMLETTWEPASGWANS